MILKRSEGFNPQAVSGLCISLCTDLFVNGIILFFFIYMRLTGTFYQGINTVIEHNSRINSVAGGAYGSKPVV